MYLIDTSVWIDFLRGNKSSKVSFLENLLESGEAFMCDTTFCEVCFGAVDRKQWKKYRDYFSEMPFLKLPEKWSLTASEMGFVLRKSGYKPNLADLSIALTAIHNKVPLLTHDSDFQVYHRLFGLVLH